MTTMLEKAAIAAGDVAATMDADVRHVLTEAAIERVVRAVLMAVREPSVEMAWEGVHAKNITLMRRPKRADCEASFTAMIDAILNEGEDNGQA